MVKVIDAPDISPLPEYKAAAELRRLQDENETLRGQLASAEYSRKMARADSDHLRQMLNDYLSRPPVGAPLARRVKYLLTGL